MTKIIMAYELLEQKVPKSCIAKHLTVSRRTVIRWSQGIEKHGGLEEFLEYYQQAKKGSRKKRKIDAVLKRRIWTLREKHHQCCGQKIQYFLEALLHKCGVMVSFLAWSFGRKLISMRKNGSNRNIWRNWPVYNHSLVNRGAITLWIDKQSLSSWSYVGPRQRGRQFLCADAATECLLTLRAIFHLTMRATEGFSRSLLQLMDIKPARPGLHYTLPPSKQPEGGAAKKGSGSASHRDGQFRAEDLRGERMEGAQTRQLQTPHLA